MDPSLTELAYLVDSAAAYQRSFTARITSLPPGAVVLSRTYFYPVGGGQPCDLGTLSPGNGSPVPVREVSRTAGMVLHRLGRFTRGRAPGWTAGDEVRGEIDWARRYSHMRLHTAQHLLSALVFQTTGRPTDRVSLGGRRGAIEVGGPRATSMPIEDIRYGAAGMIRDRLEVRVRWISRVDYDRRPPDRSGARSLPHDIDPVRVIDIGDVDTCPCGGTHVRSLAELGSLEVLAPIPLVGGGQRIGFTLPELAQPTSTG